LKTTRLGQDQAAEAKENLKGGAAKTAYVDGPLLNLAVTNRELGDKQRAIDALKQVVANKPDWGVRANRARNGLFG
jgi:hypothetical protein